MIKITFEDIKDANCTGICEYCRLLVSKNKEDLNQKIEVYRGNMLCLIVNDIRKAAKLEPDVAQHGFRLYRPYKHGRGTSDALKHKEGR